MDTPIIVVPHDFTKVGDVALKYALFIGQPQTAKIVLLNIISNKSEEAKSMKKLEEIIANTDAANEIVPAVEVGNIFDDIPKFAKQNNAQLIVMGTHGALGMQKVFGSYAMKVVTNSNIPFLVVQDEISDFRLKNIVIPITFSKESLQIINIGMRIANLFDAKIHIIMENYTDPLLLQKANIRMALIEKQFEEFYVDHVYEVVKDRSFQKGILNYAKENDCDIIAIAHYSESLIPQLDRFTQGLITNKENIPCLVINAKLLTSLYF